jgi:DNA transposition AAA+ family ATPase
MKKLKGQYHGECEAIWKKLNTFYSGTKVELTDEKKSVPKYIVELSL